jgi:hypothetical protein
MNIFFINAMNEIQKLYIEFPNKPWDLPKLLRNPNITLDFIKARKEMLNVIHNYAHNPNANKDFYIQYYDPRESAHLYVKNITWDIAIINPTRYKEYFMLAIDPEITWERVKNNPQYPWNFTELSKHKCITLDIINSYPEYGWDYAQFMFNENCTQEFALEHIDLIDNHKAIVEKGILPLDYFENVDMFWVTWHPKITIEFIKKHKDKIACVRALHIPREDIINNPDIKWIFYDMLKRDEFTFEDLLPFAKTDEDWRGLSCSHAVTIEIIEQNPHLPWSWMDICSNINITWLFVMCNLEKKLNWFNLSMNSIVTMDIIRSNPHLPWDLNGVSLNPNLTAQFVIERKGREFDFELISENRLGL